MSKFEPAYAFDCISHVTFCSKAIVSQSQEEWWISQGDFMRKIRELADENVRLRREVYALRLFGNKDCTAMADDYLQGEAGDSKGD